MRPGRDLLIGSVEVDESYIGGEEEGLPGRLNLKKALVAVAAQQDGPGIGRIRVRQVIDASAESLIPFIRDSVQRGSTVHTDGWLGYLPVERSGYQHQVTFLKGKKKTPSELMPRVHRVISLLKRWLLGTHQGMTELGLGYAPGGQLRRHLANCGYSLELLLGTGLINDRGQDAFCRRVIFPCYQDGRVINLYGRSIGAAFPHRLLPRSKGGLFAWESVTAFSTVILVEGLLDLAVLWQAGFRNTTCAIGTCAVRPAERPKTGTDAFETWIPVGGFKLEHRKGKTPEGETLITDWLVPQWAHDDLTAAHPLAEQPCLHRVLAECSHDQVVRLAGLYGLLTATGKSLPPEPVDQWRREIRELRTSTALWDGLAGADAAELRRLLPHHPAAKGKELVRVARERLARQVTEKISGGRLELINLEDGGPFTIHHRPVRLIDAIWQRFAEEIAGMITPARCPAPGCGRWFPRSVGRSDRQFCSHACQMRAWRKGSAASAISSQRSPDLRYRQ